jgi:hypothetical protein
VDLALAFVHPGLLWAAPLVLVPLVIHLLNRRRYQRVRWAAMQHLLAALKRNRRRIRMEQWLVLLLRMLAVAGVVLLVTRPRFSGEVFGDASVHHVVCLDDSASMAQRSGGTDCFRLAVAAVQSLVRELAAERTRDSFTLLRASAPTAPDKSAVRVGPALAAEIEPLLNDLAVGDGTANLPELLARARDRAADTDASRSEIYLVTDLRRVDWLGDGDTLDARLTAVLESFDRERQHLNLVVVRGADDENLGIVAIRRLGRVAPQGVPLEIGVEVKNQGRSASPLTELALELDGKGRELRALESLPPGATRLVTFTHAFSNAGFHAVSAALAPDRYPVDDARALAVRVVESSRVLLVDGDPGERPEEAETFFLAAALEHRESGIAVEVIPEHLLQDRDLTGLDMVWLCNVAAPPAPTVEKLEEFVRGGGGLAVFCGDRVDAQSYDAQLFEDGRGLLPAALTGTEGDLDHPQHVFVADPAHGAVDVAGGDLVAMFAKLVLVGRHAGVLENPDAKVVLRLRDGSGPPLLLTRRFEDGGEVALITTTADTRWTNWPRWAAFLIVCQQLHRISARPHADAAFNLEPSDTLSLPVDLARYRPDVVVRPDAADGAEITFTASAGVVEIPMRALQGCGTFRAELTPFVGAPELVRFARNTVASEGQLQRLEEQALRRALPENLRGAVTVLDGRVSLAEAAPSGEVWRAIALAILITLVAESVLAWRFGRR